MSPLLNSKLSAALRQFLYTRPIYIEYGAQSEIPKQHVVLSPGGGGIQNLQQETQQGLTMLMILSTVVLLIACANIANLLLGAGHVSPRRCCRAHGHGRSTHSSGTPDVYRERAARLHRRPCGPRGGLCSDRSTILALAFPDARNLPIQASPSLPILGFAFLVSLVTGILFGIAPAWLSSHAQPAEVLRGVNRSTRDRSSLPQKALVVFQAALSVVLLAGAILMTRSLGNLQHQNFGIQTENRYVFHLDPAGAGYTVDRLPGLYRQSRIASLRCPAWPLFRSPCTVRWKATTGARASLSRAIPCLGRTTKAGPPGIA